MAKPDEDIGKLPVVVLSGFLGAGKTTLLKHLLENSEKNMRIGCLVNDMAEINVDAALIRSMTKQEDQEVMELHDGCICCTLREDFIQSLFELASGPQRRTLDCLVVESTGISEPMSVAEAFAVEFETDGRTRTLEQLLSLNCMVTVIDAKQFPDDLRTKQRAGERWEAEKDEPEGERSITDLLMDQVEFANVLVLNKSDLVDAEQLEKTRHTLKALNPQAHVVTTHRAKMDDLSLVLSSKLFSMEDAGDYPGWLSALKGEKLPESLEYGISSFVYRRRRPFHPARFASCAEKLADECYGVVRMKGFVWIATRHGVYGEWSQAGVEYDMFPGDFWYAARDRESWDDGSSPDFVKKVLADFEDPYGDRRQEIVIIGVKLDQKVVEDQLDKAILTDSEFELGPEEWAKFEDPFEEWLEVDEDEDYEDEDGDGDIPDDEQDDRTPQSGQRGEN